MTHIKENPVAPGKRRAGPISKTQQANYTNPAAEAIARIRQILGPAVKLYGHATPPMPACECLTSAPCLSCRSYAAVATAGSALIQGGRSNA